MWMEGGWVKVFSWGLQMIERFSQFNFEVEVYQVNHKQKLLI